MPKSASHAGLDHPIWSALTTRQAAIAEGDALARRYPLNVAPFAAMREASPAGFASLARLIAASGRVALFTAERIAPPDSLEMLVAKTAEQMVATTTPDRTDAALVRRLGAADVPAMLELVELTKPGPFAAHTHQLGDFVGIRVGGQLAAMAGERMKLDGFTEITAVCTHPDHRGKGYAQIVLNAVSRGVLARGETPFLHVFSDNLPAIQLYLRLGFTVRRQLHLSVLDARGATPPIRQRTE